MIRRVTPSKRWGRERGGSCCGVCEGREEGEAVVELREKVYQKGDRQESSRKNKKLQLYGFSKKVLSTPKASMLPTRTNSLNKTYILSTAPADQSSIDQIPQSPIQRLKQRLSFGTSLKAGPARSSYFGNILNENINNQSTIPLKMDRKQSGLRIISKEVEEYKAQYSGLVSQFRRLKKEKSGNRKHFQQLLSQIEQKGEIIRLLQQQRSEEMHILREQFSQLPQS